ncbi:adenylate/guanylate cyclase domain-containing protein [Pseudactinotalea sp. HY158]|uniref:adenylate/guanylate cyclase domain-containing protein n=1 Tax=Pseudactinotalea sp. HY158 TaxID=2654547 RepID=UPI00129D1E63|nr:adenylate/guanylate cyclase domain-containing protein [Pseudactinotalea sp. HY158]QGH68816.1 adenylate/guanylate cyclase domain-containing protein [Pseudactinotalea sp. HY158]
MAEPSPHSSTYGAVAAALLGPGPRRHLGEVAESANVSEDDVRAFWRLLGFADVPDEAPEFTDADVAAMRDLMDYVRTDRIGLRTARTLVRANGHLMDRLVLWQVESFVEEVAQRYSLDDISARLVVLDRFLTLQPMLEEQLLYTWRRQLAALLGRFDRQFAQSTGLAISADQLPLERAVGFMDMVGYTSRTVRLARDELAEIVAEFETTARDVVARNGARVVKTVGDAVLYVADDLPTGAKVATDLVDLLAAVDLPVRSSVVWGRVLSRSGDIFGPTVNLASRLNDVATPGVVVMDDVSAALLEVEGPEFDLTPMETVSVQGMGPVNPVRLRRRQGSPRTRRANP